MTALELQEAGILITDDNPKTILSVMSGLEWLKENTILEIEPENAESIRALPSRVKLFLLKFVDILERENGISSESIDGLSQSFESSNLVQDIDKLSKTLIADLLKSQVKFIPAKRRW